MVKREVSLLIVVMVLVMIFAGGVSGFTVVDETEGGNVEIHNSAGSWTVSERGEIWIENIEEDDEDILDSTVLIDEIDGDKRVIAQRDMEASGSGAPPAGYDFVCSSDRLCKCTQRDATTCTDCVVVGNNYKCFENDKFPVEAGDVIKLQRDFDLIFHYEETCECSGSGTRCVEVNLETCDGCMFANPVPDVSCGYYEPCNDSQRIFRISERTGGFGQLWNIDDVQTGVPGVEVFPDSSESYNLATDCGTDNLLENDEVVVGLGYTAGDNTDSFDSKSVTSCVKADFADSLDISEVNVKYRSVNTVCGDGCGHGYCNVYGSGYVFVNQNNEWEYACFFDRSSDWTTKTCDLDYDSVDSLLICRSGRGYDSDNLEVDYVSVQTKDTTTVVSEKYPIDVCYDDIFPEAYSADGTEHDCIGSNSLFRLSDVSDAHVVDSGGEEVCYGDLGCSALSSDCGSNENCVVRIDSDGELSLCDETGGEMLCCRSGGAVEETGWRNMNGDDIDSADLEDNVKLVVSGSGFEGRNIDFTIYKDEFWFFDSKVSESSSVGSIVWKAGENADGGFAEGDYYFTAEVEGLDSYESGILTVGPRDNSIPVAGIVKPVDRGIYFVGENIEFEQSSYDVDDKINWTWNFNSEAAVFGDNTNMLNYNVVHSFDSAGQKRIVLNVTDTRGAVDRAEVNILVIDSSVVSDYVLAYISEPDYGEPVGDFEVDFNGEMSYAVSYDSGVISCLGGMCPANTSGCLGPYPVDYSTCQLDVVGTSVDYSALNFAWGFDDGPDVSYSSGDGVEIKHEYSTEDGLWHLTDLTVLVGGAVGTADVLFEIRPDNVCIGGYWWEDGDVFSGVDTLNVCQGDDEDSADDDCCPSDHECIEEDGDFKCVEIDTCRAIYSCSDYDNYGDCRRDDCDEGSNRNVCGGGRSIIEACGVEISDIITRRRSCDCYWDDDANGDEGECKQKHNVIPTTYESLDVSGMYHCEVDVSSTECVGGEMIVTKSVVAEWVVGGTSTAVRDACAESVCDGYEKRIACGKPMIQLPFFMMFNFVIVVFVLIMFYIVRGEFVRIKKKKKR